MRGGPKGLIGRSISGIGLMGDDSRSGRQSNSGAIMQIQPLSELLRGDDKAGGTLIGRNSAIPPDSASVACPSHSPVPLECSVGV